MKKKLLPRERVKMAINHQEPDRPPIQFYATPEVGRLLTNYFKGQDLKEVFELDFRRIGPKPLKKPRKPMPGSGIDKYDMWGAGYKNSPYHLDTIDMSGTYPEPVYLPFADFKTMDDVVNYPWPSPDDFDYSVIPEQIKRNKSFAIVLGNAGIPDIINGTGVRGRGMEQLLMDISLQDEVGIAIIDQRVNFCYEYLHGGLEAGQGKIDIVHLGEDLGSQKGLLISPEMFDAFFRPRYQKFFNLAHHYGAKVWLHSCGSTYFLHSRFIEMGLDVLDSVQTEPANMDPERLKTEFGDKLTYCGMIDTQRLLPYGTVEECRTVARHRIKVIGRGGGYIFCPSHDLQIDTPLENILVIYEEITGKKFM